MDPTNYDSSIELGLQMVHMNKQILYKKMTCVLKGGIGATPFHPFLIFFYLYKM